ncbi:Protein C34E11.2 b, partial [Aphelenchoides avenae]
MDGQGNLKAMARGTSPVFVQGWKDGKTSCMSEKIVRMHGRLMTKTAVQANDEDRVVKIFDMRKFKHAVERDPCESESEAKTLLFKTCVRIALLKDGGGGSDLTKTPCWFMIINM